jgi:hypothetical protein
VINPFRWKWAAFVLFGVEKELPFSVVEQEGKARNCIGMRSLMSDYMGKERRRGDGDEGLLGKEFSLFKCCVRSDGRLKVAINTRLG